MQNDPFNPNQVPQGEPVTPPEPQPQPQFGQQSQPQPVSAPAPQFTPEQSAQPVQPTQPAAPQFAQPQPQQPQPMQQPVMQPKKANKGLIIGIAAGVAALLIAGGVVFYMSTRDSGTTTGQSAAGGSSESSASEGTVGDSAGGGSSFGVNLVQSMASKAYGVSSAKVAASPSDAKHVIVTVEVDESPISATALRGVVVAIVNGSYGTFETATIEIVKGGAADTAADVKTAITRMGKDGSLLTAPTSSSVTFPIDAVRDLQS